MGHREIRRVERDDLFGHQRAPVEHNGALQIDRGLLRTAHRDNIEDERLILALQTQRTGVLLGNVRLVVWNNDERRYHEKRQLGFCDNLQPQKWFLLRVSDQGEALELLEAQQAKGHLDAALGVDAQVARLDWFHAVHWQSSKQRVCHGYFGAVLLALFTESGAGRRKRRDERCCQLMVPASLAVRAGGFFRGQRIGGY